MNKLTFDDISSDEGGLDEPTTNIENSVVSETKKAIHGTKSGQETTHCSLSWPYEFPRRVFA